MSDWLRHIAQGAPVRFSTKRENAISDVLRAYLRDQNSVAGNGPKTLAPGSGIIYVQNNSGQDVQPTDVLGVDDILIDPADNENGFKFGPALAGVTPTTAAHTGRFVIAFDPIAKGKIGRATLAGYCAAYVNVLSTGDEFADVTDGSADHLTSGASGAAQIIWAQGGTGNQWAVVRLAAGAAAMPKGQYQFMIYQMVSQNQTGWDFCRAHGMT